jgi:hypothetical protein
MKTVVTLLLGFILTSAIAQKNLDSLYKTNIDYRRSIGVIYSEKYILNSDAGDLTFFDQGHPAGRQYLLVSNIVPYFALTRRRSPLYFVINPIVRVRQFINQPSLPIRTPSYQIGGILFFNPFRHDIEHYKYLNIGIYHHSNGQDNPPFNDDGTVNFKTGNFVTNFIVMNFFQGYHREEINSYYKVGLEIHSGLFKIADEPLLRSRFSKFRVNGQYSISRYGSSENLSGIKGVPPTKERYIRTRFTVDGTIGLDKIEAVWNQHFNLELKFYYNLWYGENTTLFASAGYMGIDYYNIYFTEPYPFIRVGIAAGSALQPIEKVRFTSKK